MSVTVTAPFNPETGETYEPAASPEEVVALLRRSLDLFGEKGENWNQSAVYCSYVAVLIGGAAKPEGANAALAALLDTLGEPIEWTWYPSDETPAIGAKPLIEWNDAEGRTFTEVKSLFESTIERLER